jgi:hypothetical protein
LEPYFEHKIPKLNFVFHSKISLENLTKIFYDKQYHKKVEKNGKTLISFLVVKIPYFSVFPLFGGIFSNVLIKFFNGKQNLV